MKTSVVLIILNIAVVVAGITSGFWLFSREKYITEEILEISTPFSVTIDVEFLKNLEPAYEQ
jgi:hypothetical protein